MHQANAKMHHAFFANVAQELVTCYSSGHRSVCVCVCSGGVISAVGCYLIK